MGYETDKRYSPQNFAAKEGRASAPPRLVAAVGRSGGATETSQKAFEESARRNQYRHPVRAMKAPHARIE